MSRLLESILRQRVNQKSLSEIITVGKLPELEDDEREAIMGHTRGNMSHLMRENFIVHKRGLIVTKTMEDIDSIPDFVEKVMYACNFDFQISIVWLKL